VSEALSNSASTYTKSEPSASNQEKAGIISLPFLFPDSHPSKNTTRSFRGGWLTIRESMSNTSDFGKSITKIFSLQFD
jgi:hypothetical protein